ncbi:PTS system mannitol-specific EIICBA component [compost metagenome]|uniref:PTS system mannitol-specific EIICB component n=1 Tax=Paenibacillus rhizolycopersici TaxID=2780073 RepID=A0ABS2HB37_9BACL|nr:MULTISPECIES: PTS mannitol transporter subunit IICBA [Paenibacillus]MBM6997014.1 PTS mannitol transporter subunit IICBA [Paenibacillus rhizolycopersici]MUG86104.1 PTS mannitol transporter subunit IICBA [Paenibacillus timonensis]GIP50453.1 PTS system mannitol-specific EIICB component [Paenibacillus sp. J53TS2]
MAIAQTKKPSAGSGGARVKVQQFGRALSGMVMPNIGAFIAWGLITALFIPTGWIPSEYLAKLVDPMIKYLLPLLIGYTGGNMVHGKRGAVTAAIVTMGVIVGSDIPMFLGAMIVGPLSAWIIKQFDKLVEGKIKSGFEMLVNNFSIGIFGGLMALGAYSGIGPVVTAISKGLSSGVDFLVEAKLLPLVNLLIEPGKVLFLNNAINHGVITPIASEEALRVGKSMLYMLESNPGPGLGILLAYWVFGRGMVKQSAPGAVVIHFLGGIHEIYFPYILMKPILILAAIAGGVAGTFTFQLTGAGLVGSPSPGSIFAYFLMTPKGGYVPMLSGVIVATVVSFLIASLLLKTGKQDEEDMNLEEASAKMKEMKSAGSKNQVAAPAAVGGVQKETVNKIVFACDAGMGSSAMGASVLRKKMQDAGVKVTVVNSAVSEIPSDADIVITQKTLTDRAIANKPDAEHISIDNFLKSPKYDELVERLKG